MPREIHGSYRPNKHVIFFEGGVLNILPEYVRSATTVLPSMLSQAFVCMRVPCVIGAVYVVKDSNALFGGERVLANNKL